MDAPSDNDAETLKNLRIAAGLDLAQLAAMANLSLGQVRQLEDGADSQFYSPQIKAQSMRRVLRLLQNQPSPEALQAQNWQEPTPKSVNVIDDIIRLSETNLKNTIDTSLVPRSRNHLSLAVGLALVLVLVFVLLNWQASQSVPQKIFAEWVEPAPHLASNQGVSVKEEPVVPVPVSVSVPVPVEPPASAPVTASAVPALSDCKQLKNDPTPAAPPSVNKAGTYVYLLASKDLQVCVDDGKRVSTLVNLKAGEGRSIHGASPWVIGALDMAALQVYFQGVKVFIPKDAGQRIVLKEQALTN